MIKEQLPTWVRSDVTDAAKRKLNEAANFFKHADKDHDEVIEFSQSLTELLLYDAVRKYQELTGEIVPILGVYDAWYCIGPGAGLVVDTERQRMLEDIRRAFPNATRGSFFREVLPMIAAIVA